MAKSVRAEKIRHLLEDATNAQYKREVSAQLRLVQSEAGSLL